MFETVAPETFQRRSRRLFYETLPLSIALHAGAIAAAGVITVWIVVFPTESPRLIRAYSLVTLPEPPPPPPPPRAQPPEPVETPPPQEVVAPTIIPDAIPALPDPPPPSLLSLTPAPAPAADAGVPGGSENGQIGGEIGGKLHGAAEHFFPSDGRVHIERNQSLPLTIVSQ